MDLLSVTTDEFAFFRVLFKLINTVCSFFVGLLFLSIIILRFIHLVACIKGLLLNVFIMY